MTPAPKLFRTSGLLFHPTGVPFQWNCVKPQLERFCIVFGLSRLFHSSNFKGAKGLELAWVHVSRSFPGQITTFHRSETKHMFRLFPQYQAWFMSGSGSEVVAICPNVLGYRSSLSSNREPLQIPWDLSGSYITFYWLVPMSDDLTMYVCILYIYIYIYIFIYLCVTASTTGL